MSDNIDQIIKRTVDNPRTRAIVINLVASATDAEPEAVKRRLDELERRGEIYCVGDGLMAEVKRP